MKNILLGIVDRKGSFSDGWLKHCEEKNIAYKRIDPYVNSIVEDLRTLSAFVWHIPHFSPKDELLARHLLYCCEKMGVPTFPSLDTFWTFDDKVAQKYILEMSGCPFVPTYVFYEKESALAWIDQATLPVVFKLKCGAGSRNVSLLRTRSEAVSTVNQAFNKGFKASSGNVTDAAAKIKSGKLGVAEVVGKVSRLPKTVANVRQINRLQPRQIGYAYFQEFIPDNTHDTRVTVIGDRAIGFRRGVRPNDFRASGSGSIDYDQSKIDPKCVEISFQLAKALNSQSICIDFVMGKDNNPLVVEISYVYLPECVQQTGGYWSSDMQYHHTSVWPPAAILDDLLGQRNEC